MPVSMVVPMLTLMAALAGPPAPARAAIAEPLYRVERVDVEGDPGRVVLTLAREMRTAGWDLRVASVDVPGPDRRIVVRLETVAPDGPVAQVISRREVRVDLGAMPPGRYVLEFREHRDRAGEPEPVQAEVLIVAGTRETPAGR
jgi:hypothetical protein